MMKSLRHFGLVALFAAVLPLAACSGEAPLVTAPPAPHLDGSETDPATDPPPADGTDSVDRTKNSIGNIR